MFPNSLVELCHPLLNDGVDQLEMPVGIVSHIYNDIYQIVAINSVVGPLVEGALFPLQSTYCRDIYRDGKTLAVTEIDGTPGMRLHPLYVSMPLEAYIATPIRHKGKIWGTVNFTSNTIRRPFSKSDVALVEDIARKVAAKLDEIDDGDEE